LENDEPAHIHVERGDATVSANQLSAQAMSVEFVDASLRIVLTDGREISAPIEWFPRLRDASAEQRGSGA
jgi:hypothetical protein